MLTVTERFARWIALSRLSQSEIARQLGHHRSFVTKLKKGIIRPTLNDAVKLEALSGIPAVAWAVPARARSGSRRTRQTRNSLVA